MRENRTPGSVQGRRVTGVPTATLKNRKVFMDIKIILMVGLLAIPSFCMSGTIHDIVERGTVDELREYVINNPDQVNSKDNYGWSALHRAIENNNKDKIILLLSAGADASAKTNAGWDIDRVAQQSGAKDALKAARAAYEPTTIRSMREKLEKERALRLALVAKKEASINYNKNIQKMLRELGYYDGAIDGNFGAGSKLALDNFSGLEANAKKFQFEGKELSLILEKHIKDRFAPCKNGDSIALCSQFIKANPNSRFAGEANNIVRNLEKKEYFDALRTKGDRASYLEAGTLERNGKFVLASEVYEFIVKEFPDSDLALKANDRLLKMAELKKQQSKEPAVQTRAGKSKVIASTSPCSGIKVVHNYGTYREQLIGPKLYGYYVKLKNSSSEVKDVYLSFFANGGWGESGYYKLRVYPGDFAEEQFGGAWAYEHTNFKIDTCE